MSKVKKIITEEDKKKALQNAIHYLTQQEAFYGSLLQELTIQYRGDIPTAAITFNQKHQQFEVYINPEFFIHKLGTNEFRRSVLHHEILHFTNKHLFRLPFLKETTPKEERFLFNIAGDMAINQYIQPLPDGCKNCKDKMTKSPEEWEALHPTEEDKEACPGKCVNVADWLLDDGTPFPTLQSMETYYELIKKERDKQQKSEDDKKDGKGQGTKGNVLDHLKGYRGFDEHIWDSLDEETKQKMLDEARKVLRRTIEKTSYTHTNVPDSIKDLLQEIDSLAAGLNYKQILRQTIKRTVSATERENTWHKPNRKYGVYSQGSKVGALPKVHFYGDSSGSMSVKEMNQFLHVMSEFLKAGAKTCMLGLWHTNLYYKQKYKLGTNIDKSIFESGGTDVTETIADIRKTKPDLAIIFTDLYFDMPDIRGCPEIIWVVTEGGNKNHKFPKEQKVIYLDKLV